MTLDSKQAKQAKDAKKLIWLVWHGGKMPHLLCRQFLSLISALIVLSLTACNALAPVLREPADPREQSSALQRKSLVSETLLADFGSSNLPGIAVAPDHRSIAYGLRLDKKTAVVWNGKQGKPYDSIFPQSIRFSPDSQHIAYVAGIGSKWIMVVDGIEDSPYDWIGEIYHFSPDSKQVIYGYLSGSKSGTIVHLIGKQSYESDDNISSNPNVIVSADGKRKAIRRSIGGDIGSPDHQEFVIVDGNQDKLYDFIVPDSISFSPDSQHIVYIAEADNFKSLVVLDGREKRVYVRVDEAVFSPDSQHLSYVAEENYQDFVVFDERELKRYRGVGQITFSPDSKRLAYAVNRLNHSSLAIIDGEEIGPYDGVGSFVFSSDSQQIAFIAENGKKKSVVLNKIAGRTYDSIAELVFSPDGAHVASIAQNGNKVFVVVDGLEGPIYDGIAFTKCECDRAVAGRGLNFDTSNTLHYLAMKGNQYYLIEEELQ